MGRAARCSQAMAMPGLALCFALASGCSELAASKDELSRTASAIVGGEPDVTSSAVLLVDALTTGSNALCTATLLSPNLVLTARHCVTHFNGSAEVDCNKDGFGAALEPAAVTFSTAARQDNVEHWLLSRRIIVGAEADPFCGNDLALVILEEPVPSKVATPLVPRFFSDVVAGERYSAVGFGGSSARNISLGVRYARSGLVVQCAGFEDCDRRSAETEFRGEDSACEGDSGGPAFDAQGRLIGVLSRGYAGCTSPIYTRVASFSGSIVQAAREAARVAGLEPPAWASAGDAGLPEPVDGGYSRTHTPREVDAAPTLEAPARLLPEASACAVGVLGANHPDRETRREGAARCAALLWACLSLRRAARSSARRHRAPIAL